MENLKEWEHLSDIELPKVEEHGAVALLIGQDNPDTLIPIDIRKGRQGVPYALKTLLGWTHNGPLGDTCHHHALAN